MEAGQDSPPLAVGTRVDAYQVADVVEQGRYSYTYLGRDAAGAEVLIKEFLPHEFAVRDGDTVRAREAEDKTPLRFWLRSFLDKAVLLQKLNHPGLVRVLKQFEANGTGYYVTERIAGQSLAEILQRDGTLSEAQLRRLLAPILSGLEQAHAVALLHRDIRPENIMVRGDDSAVLAGFGVLRAPIRFKSRTVFSAGAPPYAAPEEFFMAGPHGPWTDLYALGATLWRAVTGAPPPDARSRGTGPALPPVAMSARVRLSESMAAAIDQALRLPAEQRPQSIALWRAGLQGEGVPEADATGAIAPQQVYAAAPPRRSPVPLLAGIGVAVAAVIGGWFMLHSSTPPQPAGDAAETAAPAIAATAPAQVAPTPVAATAPAAAQAATPAAGNGANLDQLALDLMAKEKKLNEAQQLLQAQREQLALEARNAAARSQAAAQPQQAAAAAAPAPAPSAEDERLKQLQAEVDRLRKEKEQAATAPTVANAAPAVRSGPGPAWNTWYRDALGTVKQSLHYPTRSLQGGEEGDVMVKVLLKRDGSIVKTELSERTPYSALNGEALAVFSRIGHFPPVPADYSPGNNQVEMSMPINFKIAVDQ